MNIELTFAGSDGITHFVQGHWGSKRAALEWAYYVMGAVVAFTA